MKIPFYSPKCQSLSSSNKVLINNIGILLKIQKKKKQYKKIPDSYRKSYYSYYICTNKIKFHALYTKNK